MGVKQMPAPNEMMWYKWFPAKALTSLRWASLTVTEEGVYRRMYDLASLAQPSSRRGYFYEHDIAADIKNVWTFLRIDARTGQKCLDLFAKLGLMDQDENGAWGFPNFAKHQRTAMLRRRKDGLGSAEAADNRRKSGAESALEKQKHIRTDAEAEREREAANGVPIPPSLFQFLVKECQITGAEAYLPDWVKDYDEAWIYEAGKRCLSSAHRSARYMQAILRRFAQEGGPDTSNAGYRKEETAEERLARITGVKQK